MNIKISRHQSITWPKMCVVCGVNTDTKVKARCSIVDHGSAVPGAIMWKSSKYSVDYPLCSKHKKTTLFARVCSERNMWNLAICYLAAIALIMGVVFPILRHLKGLSISENQLFYGSCVLFALVVFSSMIYSLKMVPVKLLSADQHWLSIKIKSTSYAEAFKKMNENA